MTHIDHKQLYLINEILIIKKLRTYLYIKNENKNPQMLENTKIYKKNMDTTWVPLPLSLLSLAFKPVLPISSSS